MPVTLEGRSMPRELIFLVSAWPPESGIEAGVPCRMKVSNNGEANPLVAFASEDLGRQLIVGCRMSDHVTLVPFSELAPIQAQYSRKQAILFFERSEEVIRYLQRSEKFDFSTLTASFEDASRKLRATL